MSRTLVQVDVFTTQPLAGNPAAIVLDGDGLTDVMMQRIAREMNLSETVFVLPATDPKADYRVRIFTPSLELDFAGHPTVGTVHALVEAGRLPAGGTFVQECRAGLVPVVVMDGLITLTSPEATIMPARIGAEVIAEMLGCDRGRVLRAATVDVGVAWFTVEVDAAEVVASLEPDLTAMKRAGLDVTVYAREAADGEGPWVRVRSFAPLSGITEDPVCGSGNACVAALLARAHALPASGRYWATQGEECGRAGRVEVEVTSDGRIRIGGRAVTVMTGALLVD